MNHTPTPWAACKVDFDRDEWMKLHLQTQVCIVKGLDILAIVYGPDDQEEENAAFIVRAVNSHQRLLDACKFVADNLDNRALAEILDQAIFKATKP